MTEKWEKIIEEANSCLDKGDFDGTIRLCDKVINLPENAIPREARADAFVVRGNAYQKKGDLDRAISDYDEAIKIGFKLDPKNSAAFNNRGNAYREKGNLDRAISDCDKAIDLDPKNSAAFNNRGIAYREKGDFDRAISDCDKAIKIGFKLDSENAAALSNRGIAYKEKGDFDRAISDCGEAIKLDPKNAAVFNNRGIAYREKGDLDHAISDYDEAIKIGFKLDSENAATLNNRGNAYQEKGNLDRAISDYDEAIKLDPNLTGAFHNRALVYGRLNAQADEKKYREGYEQEMQKLREELRKVSDPGEVIETYKKRENEYKAQIKALGDEIKTFADELHNRLAEGFVGIAFFIVAILIFGDNPLGLAHGFTLTSLMLAWLAVNYPASIRLSDMRKEKRKMEICAEDYFRKLTLARYALAADGDERKKMMAVTHAHFATRSAAEFLADWNPASDDKSNPLFDSIEKIVRRKDDDSPPKPPETKPSA